MNDLNETLRSIAMAKRDAERVLPITEERRTIHTGGEIIITGPDSAVVKRIMQLEDEFPWNPYDGHVSYRKKLGDGMVKVIFRWRSAD